MEIKEIEALLNVKVNQFNTKDFIKDDPILLPHRFQRKQDIEIIGFIVALIAWGKRKMIIDNGNKLIQIMGNAPFEYVQAYTTGMLDDKKFVHRTFNTIDLDFIIRALQKCYRKHDSLEAWFSLKNNEKGIKQRIINFRTAFMEVEHEKRSEKHIANPEKGSAAKRINMFLRWMVRKDEQGVDFGIWKNIDMSELYVPLDVHTGNVARKLGLITRKQNDWRALEEMMLRLQKMNVEDPCKYDFALFGLGVSGELEEK
ncbi:TIGR02757 family protein [Brumimicrobium salinarum]|uniref:TIGR02757 family protein n=1 Tax=Brumimicrobium salinarum TaxID=2058658 RepID=A0A2I0R583_9FLAO|nr:TIGR02757 family protein [Brumimicrobium salinarum]PKR81699.1 TIGR02757 family protein [Brumimicrobium salinarum]